MAIKLADTLAPMADFPAALAEHIEFSDGKSLQEKYDLGELGGEGGGGHIELTQAEYDALSDEEKLNGAIYFITDATGGGGDDSSHVELTQAEYDALSDEEKDSDTIYFITDAEGGSSEAELTEYSYLIIEPAGSSSIYYSYEDLSTKIGCYVPVTTYNHKHGEWVVNIYVVRQNDEGNIEIINESGYETIISLMGITTVTMPFVKDTRASSQTTWSSKQIASALLGDDQLNEFSNNSVQNWVLAGKFKEIESKLDEKGGATYTSLAELELTADATVEDVIDKLPKGGSALLGVTEFTNYQTIFPYEEGNDQFARVHIVKGTADGSRMYARWFRKDGIKEAIAKFNINDNKFDGWNGVVLKGIDDIAPTTVTTFTLPDTVVNQTNNSRITYQVKNGICCMAVQLALDAVSSAVTTWTNVATGFPKPSFNISQTINSERNSSEVPMAMRMTAGGTLQMLFNGTTNTMDWWTTTFTYPVAK